MLTVLTAVCYIVAGCCAINATVQCLFDCLSVGSAAC